MTALGITTLQLQIADFKFSHNFIIVIDYLILKYNLALMYRRKMHYPTPGTEKRTATYRRKVDSLPRLETVSRRQTLLLCNHTLRYCPDTMASYLRRSKDIQLRNIWPILSVIRTQKREGSQHTHH